MQQRPSFRAFSEPLRAPSNQSRNAGTNPAPGGVVDAQPAGNGKRKSPRRRVRVPGQISVGDRLNRINCLIVDMSASGARLLVLPQTRQARINSRTDAPSDTPNDFMANRNRIGLFFAQPSTDVECNVIWRSKTEIGVQFCGAFRHSRKEP